MKAMFMNYFKGGKLYQWDSNKDTYLISDTGISEEFCLDQANMNTFLKFENPTLTLKDGVLKVQSGKIKANLKLSDEKLVTPNLKFIETVKINVDKIKIASKFVNKSAAKPTLTGVYVGNDYVSSTDTFTAFRTACENNCNLILSSVFVKLISHLSGELEFKCNRNVIACEYQDVMYVGRLIDGTYPDLSTIFDDGKYPNETVIDKQELKKFLSYEDNKNSFVIFDNNKITTGDLNTDKYYNFETDIELSINEKICLSYEKLLNVISNIEEDKIKIKYSTGKAPVLFNGEYIILPCVIAEETKEPF